jgi:hypothetical protein
MKLNKQMMKRLNSPKSFFIFILLIVFTIILFNFTFQMIRVFFDMDKKDMARMQNAKLQADKDNNKNVSN